MQEQLEEEQTRETEMNRAINQLQLENVALKKELQGLKSNNQSKALVLHKDASSVPIDVKDDEVSKEKNG